MLQSLFEAVRGAQYGTGRQRPRLAKSKEENRSGDVTLAPAHHACRPPRRLKPGEPLLGGSGVQTTVGRIDGNQEISCTHVEQQEKLREGITKRPDARRTLRLRPTGDYHSLLSAFNSQMISTGRLSRYVM